MRLITRADLDGLTCAVLLSKVERIDEVNFAHPKDVQDGKVDIGPNDILANLPRDPRAGKVFDHHASQAENWASDSGEARGAFAAAAPSAARVIAQAYPSADFSAFEELLHQTDRLDSADLEPADVTDPQGWILIGYTLDPRTGMARYRDYFLHVLELVKAHPSDPAAILDDAMVAERVAILQVQEKAFMRHLKEDSRQDGNVVISDVRDKQDAPLGNRFEHRQHPGRSQHLQPDLSHQRRLTARQLRRRRTLRRRDRAAEDGGCRPRPRRDRRRPQEERLVDCA